MTFMSAKKKSSDSLMSAELIESGSDEDMFDDSG